MKVLVFMFSVSVARRSWTQLSRAPFAGGSALTRFTSPLSMFIRTLWPINFSMKRSNGNNIFENQLFDQGAFLQLIQLQWYLYLSWFLSNVSNQWYFYCICTYCVFKLPAFDTTILFIFILWKSEAHTKKNKKICDFHVMAYIVSFKYYPRIIYHK